MPASKKLKKPCAFKGERKKVMGALTGEVDKVPSSFSTEDLVSNLIHFYAVVENATGEYLSTKYAGRFLDNNTDEKVISKAIWLFSLKPQKGAAKWQPEYFDSQQFLATNFGLPNPMACSERFGIEYARLAQERLSYYANKFGPPTFPSYFQKYTPTSDGYLSTTKTNKSLF
ncbi:MAG: hypothetical protein M0036_09860 [Desulfobacteraceae bacterium]|nr:hypothetical protein [Desulfobacteraceae bacterium]